MWVEWSKPSKMQILSKFMKVHVLKLQLKLKLLHRIRKTLEVFNELFYAPVCVNDKFQMMGMLDSGSMACTFSEAVESRMRVAEAHAIVAGNNVDRMRR